MLAHEQYPWHMRVQGVHQPGTVGLSRCCSANGRCLILFLVVSGYLTRGLRMQDGDLDKYVRAQGGQLLPEDTIMLKFVQICLAVHYIHSKVGLPYLLLDADNP